MSSLWHHFTPVGDLVREHHASRGQTNTMVQVSSVGKEAFSCYARRLRQVWQDMQDAAYSLGNRKQATANDSAITVNC